MQGACSETRNTKANKLKVSSYENKNVPPHDNLRLHDYSGSILRRIYFREFARLD
jgi:hypothetical protein